MLNVGVSQVVPVLPLLATEMGLGAAGTGALISAPAFARLAVNLPLGRMADTSGRLPLMKWGTLLTAAGSVGTGVVMSHGLPAVLGMRMLIGAGSASSMSGSSAMMADLTDRAPQHRAQLMAFQSFVLSGVWVAGPMLGGLLAEAYGVRNAFFLAGCGIACCSVGYSQLPETLHEATKLAKARKASGRSSSSAEAFEAAAPHHQGSSATAANDGRGIGEARKGFGRILPESISSLLPLLRSSNVQALSALASASSIGQGCFMTVLTLHAREAWGATPSELGAMFSMFGLSYVAGMPIGSWLAARMGRKALIVPGLALSNLSFATLAFVDTREAFYALLLLTNLSSAITGPALGAFTAEVLPPDSRGQAGAVSRMSADCTGLVAPVALGLLADATSCGMAIVTTAGLTGGCTFLFALRAREVPLKVRHGR